MTQIMNLQNLQQKSDILLMIKIINSVETTQLLNLIQKLLNEISVTIQMPIFLLQEI